MTKSMMLVLVLAMAGSATGAATPPAQINYQGVLRDPATGIPMSGAYDAVFRFFSAETGGDEILIDTHMAAANQGLSVANGLFSVALGSGALSDGSGPGNYPSLDLLFRDYTSVWMQIEIQGQVLTPRVPVISAPYALNASNLGGKPASGFLDTSPAAQGKDGPLHISNTVLGSGEAFLGQGDVGIEARGGSAAGHFYQLSAPVDVRLASLGEGVAAMGNAAVRGTSSTTFAFGALGYGPYAVFGGARGTPGEVAGYFVNGVNGNYDSSAALGAGGSGIEATGSSQGGYFRSYVDPYARAWLAGDSTPPGCTGCSSPTWGIWAEGAYSPSALNGGGGFFKDVLYSGYAKVGHEHFGVQGFGNSMGGYFKDLNSSGEAHVANGDYGISAFGSSAGGTFRRGTPSAYTDEALLAYNGRGILGRGSAMGGEFVTASPGVASALLAYNTYGYGYGIYATGNHAGGEFHNSSYSAQVMLARHDPTYGGAGVTAAGSQYAGYFHRILVPNSFSSVYLGTAWSVEAEGNYYYSPGAAIFYDSLSNSMVQLARGSVGAVVYGQGAAGVFRHGTESGWDSWAHLAEGSSAIIGSGAKNFVQNHPYDPDSEIVYTSLEGDEAGTYTRGNGVIENGIARVRLSPSFAWVTNPDIGLTAMVTPRGEPVRIAVESVSTSELVVRAEPGARDVPFDYVVQGLRAGFERASVVRPKRGDAPIPPMTEHDQVYASHPELQAHNALERFRAMPAVAGRNEPIDLSGSEALVAAIGVGDMDAPPIKRHSLLTKEHADQWKRIHPGEDLSEWESRKSELRRDQPTGPPGDPAMPQAGLDPLARDPGSPETVHRPAEARLTGAPPLPSPTIPLLPVAEPVEPGDVLANDWARPGSFVRVREAGDRGVIGIVAGEPGDRFLTEAPVALAGMVVSCKVDATETPIEANDLLIASSLAGHAAAAGPAPRQGTVIGKALEPLVSGTGVIRVLVMNR